MNVPQPIGDLIDESCSAELTGDVAAALRQAQQALKSARTSGEPEAVSSALVSLANARFRLGQYQEAKTLAEEALSLAPPDSPTHADAILRLGACAAETDSLLEAREYYHRALAGSQGTERRSWALHTLVGVASLWSREGWSEEEVELLALVVEHPSTHQIDRDRATDLLAELESDMPPEQFVAATARNRARELEAVVQEVLGGC